MHFSKKPSNTYRLHRSTNLSVLYQWSTICFNPLYVYNRKIMGIKHMTLWGTVVAGTLTHLWERDKFKNFGCIRNNIKYTFSAIQCLVPACLNLVDIVLIEDNVNQKNKQVWSKDASATVSQVYTLTCMHVASNFADLW